MCLSDTKYALITTRSSSCLSHTLFKLTFPSIFHFCFSGSSKCSRMTHRQTRPIPWSSPSQLLQFLCFYHCFRSLIFRVSNDNTISTFSSLGSIIIYLPYTHKYSLLTEFSFIHITYLDTYYHFNMSFVNLSVSRSQIKWI